MSERIDKYKNLFFELLGEISIDELTRNLELQKLAENVHKFFNQMEVSHDFSL